ncbi:hypothetical protein VN24_16865 [Paenibacillus beijingensis]|uniref:Glycerol operon regulatory protein n=2 Tax=Paenibacillus beijingensis TaxID=1126833 RepID=A0A0D5NL95_9BACL|nr:hypothetical protein VN24_16865 [Paenibacillus beijingensis]
MADVSPSVVKSADRVLDIFELLAQEKSPMSLMDVARKLDVPTSSLYKLLQNLLRRGYVTTSANEKLFSLGPKLFETCSAYSHNISLTEEFQRISEGIAAEINESVYLSILDGKQVLYIAEKQSAHPIRFVSHMGMRLPAHSTAMGKVQLSTMSDSELKNLYSDHELGALTSRTITKMDELLREVNVIRNDGVGFSYGEAVDGVQCAAAPIFNAEGRSIAAISVSIPTVRVTPTLWEQTVDAVKRAARAMSIKMQYFS